jgi:hypothetical protein
LLEGAVHLKKSEPILGIALVDESLQTQMEPEISLGREWLDTRQLGQDLCRGKFRSFELPATSAEQRRRPNWTRPLPNSGRDPLFLTSAGGRQRSVTKKQRSRRVLTRVLRVCLPIFIKT